MKNINKLALLLGLGALAPLAASAKTLDRPGLQRALAMLRDGNADALLKLKVK